MIRAGKSGTSSGQHDAAPLLIDGFATIGVGEPTSRERMAKALDDTEALLAGFERLLAKRAASGTAKYLGTK